MSNLKQVQDSVLAEAKKGNVVLNTVAGLQTVNLDEFLKQPAEGVLYDLNRDRATVLSHIDDPKWINDFAVLLVIEKLMSERCTCKGKKRESRGKKPSPQNRTEDPAM